MNVLRLAHEFKMPPHQIMALPRAEVDVMVAYIMIMDEAAKNA